MSQLVDSHCHLHMLSPEQDVPGALALAAERGVSHFLTVAVDLPSAAEALAFARRHPQVSASAGVHPSTEAPEASVEELIAAAAEPEVVAVGETGLDYFYNEGDLDWQRERFRRHIAAAREVGKPLIIHTRDAREDTVRILREEGAREVGGVIHCFTEDYDTAQRFLELDFHISFSGILTFRNADMLRDVARRLPLERVLVETDAPYLTPVPYRGKPNQPAFVTKVAEKLAELRESDLDSIAAATTENFFRLFAHARAA
jgi:TatD DNase family protein